MWLFIGLLACTGASTPAPVFTEPETAETPVGCFQRHQADFFRIERCPCRDFAVDMTDASWAQCRSDQELVIEWPPNLPASRVDDEELQALVVCRCKETTP